MDVFILSKSILKSSVLSDSKLYWKQGRLKNISFFKKKVCRAGFTSKAQNVSCAAEEMVVLITFLRVWWLFRNLFEPYLH